MDTGTTRPLYLQKIGPFIGDYLIKILTGQRRIGKSYILRQVAEKIREENPSITILFINMEDYEFDSIKDYSDLIKYVEAKKNQNGKTALFIDEIQEIDQFEKALRHFQTKNEYDIYCTGSNASLLSGELATLLAGRYVQIRVHALSYPEFLDFYQKENTDDSLTDYLKFGGMPHLVNLVHEEHTQIVYLKNVVDSIVLRDIVARYKVRNLRFLQDLLLFLADNVGSLLSAKKISDYLKSQRIVIPTKTVLEYLSDIESVFAIDRIQRKEVNGKKIFEVGDKFYFEDTGIRHALIGYKPQDIGKIIENAVYHHLRVCGYTVFVGKLENAEIDFAAQKEDKIVYIQAAYSAMEGQTAEREFGNLLKIPDNFPKYVVTLDPLAEGIQQGIHFMNLKNFLTEFK